MHTEIEKLEIHSGKRYLSCTENADFRGLSDDNNPKSYESNYGVIKADGNYIAALAHADLFFAGMKTAPKLWSRPDGAPLEDVRALLEENGWDIYEYTTVRMMLRNPVSSFLLLHDCKVKVYEEPVLNAEKILLFESVQNIEHHAQALEKKISKGAKLFIAYNEKNQPVSLCVATVYGNAIWIEALYTAPKYRKKGYAASVVTAIKKYAQQLGCMEIAFDLEQPTTNTLFKQLGFVGEVVPRWWAFQGIIPRWAR